MGTGYYIIFGAIVFFGVLGIIANVKSAIDRAKESEIAEKIKVLDTMFENGDIDATIYKKYKNLIKNEKI